jgi:hypothetical protein
MSNIKEQYNIYDNLIGISSAQGKSGIEFNPFDNRSILINSEGYNISATGNTGSCGIESSSGNLYNCIGKSYAGNGIQSSSSILQNCVGIAGGTTSGSTLSFYSFVSNGDVEYNNCNSQTGSNNSYPLLIYSIENGKFNNCNFKSTNNRAIEFLDLGLIPVPQYEFNNIQFKNCSIGCNLGSGGVSPINLPVGSTCILNIDNCTIEGRNGIIVGYGSSVNNNIIKVGSTNNFAIIGATAGPVLVSYSNNNIKGCTSTNAGVTAISQAIPVNTNIDNVGNIVYNQRIYNGLVGYWDAGNLQSYSGSGTALNDISQNSRIDVTLSGVTYGPTSGGFLYFDGTDSGIAPHDSSLVLQTNITIEAFVYPISFSTNQNILNKDSNQGYRLRFDTGGGIRFIANGGSINYGSTGATSSINQWVHVVATHGPTGGRLYRNGQQVGSSNLAYSSINSSGNLNIGQLTGGSERFNGNIAIIRLYNRVLTPNEITQNLYADGKRFGIT